MTLYEVYLANGETEIKFNIQAIDAYLYEPLPEDWNRIDAVTGLPKPVEPEFDRINHGPFEHPVSE